MIRLTNLTKRYGKFTAVDGINLEIRRGELFGFLGPNGAGKTTTLRMIAGILQPTSGTIEIAGDDLAVESDPGQGPAGVHPGPAVCLRQADRGGVPAVRGGAVRPGRGAGRAAGWTNCSTCSS